MRNTTKLKNILRKYNVQLEMNDDESFKMFLTDKINRNQQMIEGNSYADVLKKGYSFLLKVLKEEEFPVPKFRDWKNKENTNMYDG